MAREFKAYASKTDRHNLDKLIQEKTDVAEYQSSMYQLGFSLGQRFDAKGKNVLLVSTSEDADYLSKGYLASLEKREISCFLAVFWNNHYVVNGKSVAPITQKYLQDGWKDAKKIVLVKSIISGSCVVRTNLIALLAELDIHKIDDITIAAPVMHKDSPDKLKQDFPKEIYSKFCFETFAIDDEKTKEGIVIPGIGGEVYSHLGLSDQPARIKEGYMPKIVEQKLFAD